MNVISFPKLNIVMKVYREAFSIGQKPVYWYALIILTGFLLALAFVSLTCEKRGVKKDTVFDIGLYGLFFGIIGARIYYVIFSFDEFKNNLWNIFKIWEGGLAIYGGIIAAFITAFIYCRIKKLSFFKIADVCAPGLLIGQAIGRFGNFVNCEVYGGTTDLPWGMSINGAAPVHPLFLYEALWNILGFILIVLFRDKKKADGQVICFYLFWYSLGRLFLEGMRNTDYILYVIPEVLGISQLVAGILIVLSAVVFALVTRKKKI